MQDLPKTPGTSEDADRFPASARLTQAMRLAHQIKGVAGQIGAERAAGIARLIESESKQGVATAEAAIMLGVCIEESAGAFDAFFADVKVS